MKRAFVILLASILLLGLFPLPVLGETLQDGDYQYTLDAEGNASITKYVGYDRDVTVPSTLNSHPVKWIGTEAFNASGSRNIVSITLPQGISGIDEFAFFGCFGLASITLPDSLTYIGRSALFDCTNLTSLTIPDSVTSIEEKAFKSCESLTSITIPDSVANIGDGVFFGCESLTSLTLSSGITSIGAETFFGCNNLTSITLPSGITSIGAEAFSFCDKLASINFPTGVISIGEKAFYCCQSLTTITLPDSLTTIGDSAFDLCSRVVLDAAQDSYAYRYALEKGLTTIHSLVSAEEAFTEYAQGKVSVEELFTRLNRCQDLNGDGYDRGFLLLEQSEKAQEFIRLASLLNACEAAEAKNPGLIACMSWSIGDPEEALVMAACRLFQAGASPALMERIRPYETKEQVNYAPVLWAQAIFDNVFGKERFVPSQPLPDTCLIMEDKDSERVQYNQQASGDGEIGVAKDVLSALSDGSGGKLKFTGNPHLTSVIIYILIDYPFAGTYTSGGQSFDGYDCTLNIRAADAVSGREIATMTFRYDLQESLTLSYMPTVFYAPPPTVYGDYTKVQAFLEKVLAH